MDARGPGSVAVVKASGTLCKALTWFLTGSSFRLRMDARELGRAAVVDTSGTLCKASTRFLTGSSLTDPDRESKVISPLAYATSSEFFVFCGLHHPGHQIWNLT